jgi:hypothetical protein
MLAQQPVPQQDGHIAQHGVLQHAAAVGDTELSVPAKLIPVMATIRAAARMDNDFIVSLSYLLKKKIGNNYTERARTGGARDPRPCLGSSCEGSDSSPTSPGTDASIKSAGGTTANNATG